MRIITYREALREALKQEMGRDDTIIMIGEDIGRYGGPYKVSQGLFDEFGPDRVIDTPIAETAIAGAALGAALAGLRPIAEIMYIDFSFICMDQIFNQIAKIRYMSGGNVIVPVVIRTQMGKKGSAAAQHSQCLEAIYAHIPGIKVITPSTPYDAKGLLISSIRENDPVVFIENCGLYSSKSEVPEKPYTIELGKADIKREGNDITVVAISKSVRDSLEAADELQNEGISVEVIDPRTIKPLDSDTILESIEKTHRLLITHEACKTGGLGAEIAAIVAENGMYNLDAPIKRIAAHDTPIPFAPKMEDYVLPSKNDIIKGIRELMKE
ncbi:MAG: alpha-ketoacid dehydrogenase subunit beta [Spirochaetota bacterium]|nr:MAG: alpha-ketoacid dehydrogenase subunit beta [Spirochaetota bacterium]